MEKDVRHHVRGQGFGEPLLNVLAKLGYEGCSVYSFVDTVIVARGDQNGQYSLVRHSLYTHGKCRCHDALVMVLDLAQFYPLAPKFYMFVSASNKQSCSLRVLFDQVSHWNCSREKADQSLEK